MSGMTGNDSNATQHEGGRILPWERNPYGTCPSRRECDLAPCWLTAGHRGVHECHPFHRCPEHGRVWG